MSRRPIVASGLLGAAIIAFTVVSVTITQASPVAAPAPSTTLDQLPSAIQLDTGAMSPPPGDLAIGAPPATFAGPPPAPVAPPSQLVDPPQIAKSGGTWAVLIGINDYPGRNADLRSAVNDVVDIDRVLGAAGVAPSRRLLLTDGQATARNIRRSMQWIVDRAGPDATVVIAYAGHVRQVDDASQLVIGSDGGEVADTELASLLAPLEARSAWIVIAACYGGGFTELVTPGRVLTAAAPAGRLAYENSSFHRSYLVEFVVRRAMLEDGERSVEAAFARGAQAIHEQYPDRMPVQYDRHFGDLVLGRDVAVADARGPAPGRSSTPGGTDDRSSEPSSSRPATTTTTAPNRCQEITLGVVRC